MENTRLQLLHQFYDEEPNDPFNAYGLALAYLQVDLAKAQHYFDELLTRHADYLPTYYHAAAFLVSIDQSVRAEEVYQKGIALALAQQNTKAYQELQGAYRQLIDDY
jgi:Tfp pilus assembly protein PilF